MLIEPLDSAVHMAKALGHPTRLRIVAMLERGPLCVCQLTAVLDAATSTISAHLLELRRAGAVCETRQGKWIEYRLNDEAPVPSVLTPLLRLARGDRRLDRDRDRLRDVTSVPAALLCQAGLDVDAAMKAARQREPRAARRRRPPAAAAVAARSHSRRPGGA